MISGWFMKTAAVSGSFAHELGFTLIGGVVGAALFSVVLLPFKKPLAAFGVTLLLAVPTISAVHQGYNGAAPGMTTEPLPPGARSEIATWLSATIRGTPLVVESCDLPVGDTVASRAGLPQFSAADGDEELTAAVRSACSLEDPEAAFKAMFAHGVSLLIVRGGEGSESEARQSAFQRFVARPDLFAPLFSQTGIGVFAPAFSEYFPRAYSRASEVR
jgi:hypothetical protein